MGRNIILKGRNRKKSQGEKSATVADNETRRHRKFHPPAHCFWRRWLILMKLQHSVANPAECLAAGAKLLRSFGKAVMFFFTISRSRHCNNTFFKFVMGTATNLQVVGLQVVTVHGVSWKTS